MALQVIGSWALLLVFAWSGVALTLYDQVYRPTTGLFLSFQQDLTGAALSHRQRGHR